MESQTVVASGFAEHTDPGALVIGPTGVALGWNGTLYVADSANNRIAAVPNALWRDNTFGVPAGSPSPTSSVLDDPLGLVLAPNGNILTVNGNNGLIVETAPWGQDHRHGHARRLGPAPGGAGDLFGLALVPGDAVSGSSTTGRTRSTCSSDPAVADGRGPAGPLPLRRVARESFSPRDPRFLSSRTCQRSHARESRAPEWPSSKSSRSGSPPGQEDQFLDADKQAHTEFFYRRPVPEAHHG